MVTILEQIFFGSLKLFDSRLVRQENNRIRVPAAKNNDHHGGCLRLAASSLSYRTIPYSLPWFHRTLRCCAVPPYKSTTHTALRSSYIVTHPPAMPSPNTPEPAKAASPPSPSSPSSSVISDHFSPNAITYAMAIFMLGASAGMTLYTKRTGQILLRMEQYEANQLRRNPPKFGPPTREEFERLKERW